MSKAEKKQTAAEIKKQIEEATESDKMKEAVKDGSLPLTAAVVNEINASPVSTPEVKSVSESKPNPEDKAAEIATGHENGSVDLKEWAKKRGIDWTTEDSVLSALRKSDQEFHKRQQEKKAKEMEKVYTPQPAYIPPPAYTGYSQSPYVPPQNPRQIIEELARQANMTPDDFERVAKVSREVYEAAAQADRARWQADMEGIRVENQKNSVFRELSSDPVFRRPEVAIEYHNVLEQMQSSDPQSFEKDPTQYKRAFDRALSNIGRRNLEGKPLSEGVSPVPIGMTPPLTPPRPFGQGSGGGYSESESTIDPKEFAKMSLEDKRKLLDGMGLRPSY